MVHKSTEKSEAKLMRRRPRGQSPSSPPRHSLAIDDGGASYSEGRAADDARRPILDGHTVNRTEAAAVATSHTATVMSRAVAAAPEAVAAMSPRRAIVRAEDSTVPTGSSSALLSWYGCHKQGRLQLVLRKYSFFVFFSSLLRTFCWSPLANVFKEISR